MPAHPYFPGSGSGTSSNDVTSVNGEKGDVILTAQDLNAQPHSNVLTDIAAITMPENSFLMVNNTGEFQPVTCMPAGVAWLGYTTVDQQKAHLAYANVASTGDYNDLVGKPVLFDGNYDNLSNKPTIPTVNYPVTSVNSKTGAVVLSASDVGAIATGASIPYSSLTGSPTIPPAQVQTDWNAVSGLGVLLNKPSTFTPSAHNQAWSTITSTPTTLSGYGITDAVSQASLTTSLNGYATTSALTGGLSAKFNTPTGATSQYVRGDGTLATFPTIPTVPTVVSAFTNDAGYITSVTSTQVTSALGYTPYNSTNPSSYVNQAGARTAISLTTTGTSGASTYNSTTGVLNVPVYTSPTRTFTNPVRTLNTVYQISATQDAQVVYAVDITVAALLIGGSSGRVYLEYANEVGFTTGVTVVTSSGNSTGGVLSITNVGTANLNGVIPAGKYVRLRTVNVTATPTFTFQSAQEVLL